MMNKMGVKTLEKVVLAGAFGSYIDKTSASVIGLFPDCDQDKVIAVGNAAGDGARMALLNTGKRQEADIRARQVEYVELTVEPNLTPYSPSHSCSRTAPMISPPQGYPAALTDIRIRRLSYSYLFFVATCYTVNII
jgi:hypothetical protein